MGNLTLCGLRSLHAIIIKPRWNKETSSYLTNDLVARDTTSAIGREITSGDVEMAFIRRKDRSGADTSFSGRGSLNYRRLRADEFSVFGKLGSPYRDVAISMANYMRGHRQESVTDEWLTALRMR